MEGPRVQQQRPVTSGLQLSIPSETSHGAPTSCGCSVETGVVVGGVEVPLQAARTNTPRHCTIRDLNMIASRLLPIAPDFPDGTLRPSSPENQSLPRVRRNSQFRSDVAPNRHALVVNPTYPGQRCPAPCQNREVCRVLALGGSQLSTPMRACPLQGRGTGTTSSRPAVKSRSLRATSHRTAMHSF